MASAVEEPVTIEVVLADLADEGHATALVEIIDSYARGPGGQNAPLTDYARGEMARGLAANPNVEVLLGIVDSKACRRLGNPAPILEH